ncbi:hypothetical protein J1N35_034276, partial [Gossypium stocksii]
LCQRIKVPTQANEDKIPNKGAITKQIPLRFSGEEMPKHLSSASTGFPPMTTNLAPSTFYSGFEQKVIDALEMLQQQLRMMKK